MPNDHKKEKDKVESAPPGLRPGPNLEVTVTYTSCYFEEGMEKKMSFGVMKFLM